MSVDGGPVEPNALRVTHVCCRENGEWKIVHRHGGHRRSKQGSVALARTSDAGPLSMWDLDGLRKFGERGGDIRRVEPAAGDPLGSVQSERSHEDAQSVEELSLPLVEQLVRPVDDGS